jgi:PAS domain S-box-containing protein
MVKIRFPFPLFSLLFASVAVLILGGAWYIGNERIAGEMDTLRTKEIGNVIMGVRRLDDELGVPLRQLRTLVNTPAVREAMENPAALKGMEKEFSSLLAYSGLYDKVRWIDASGIERIRVNHVHGRPEPVPVERLRQRGDSDYFKDTMRLRAGQFFISPLGLNVEQGQVEVPYKPVLRLATPLQDGTGRAQGILVLNIDARKMLAAFTESVTDIRDHAMLLNSEGYRLVGPDSEDAWGFMFQRDDALKTRNPDAWAAISRIPSGQTEVGTDGGLWTWSTAYPLKATDNNVIADVPYWLVVSHLPAKQLALIRQNAWTTIGTSALVMLLLFGVLTAWLSHALVGRTRAKIEVAQAQAETKAARRLVEAQNRFRLVVEANANGLLVVDDKGCIEMANPALERMFGYDHGELLGQPMEVLLPESERHSHEERRGGYMRAPDPRPMGAGRDLHGLRKDGSVVPIEISLSSFMENGRRYVDAVVADISVRKQIEERLQRSEAHLRLLLSTNPNGLVVMDERGRVLMTNPALDAMFGYGPGELLDQTIEALLPETGPGLRAASGPDLPRHPVGMLLGREHYLQGHQKGGGTFPIEISLSGFNEEGRSFIQATVIDRRVRIAA